MAQCGIYKLTSPSNKVYIGQAFDIEKRLSRYKSLNCKGQPYLYNSLVKYGFENHKFEILHECKEEELNDFENHYIQLFDSFNTHNGMNLRSGGGRGAALSEESKAKSGKSQKLNWIKRKENGTHKQSTETINKRMASGKATIQKRKSEGITFKHSEESKRIRSIKSKEYQAKIKLQPEYYSDKNVQKRKEASKKAQQTKKENGIHSGNKKGINLSGKNNPFYGRRHSKETLEKIAKSRKITWDKKIENGWKQSKEHIAKRVQKQLGQKRTEAQIENMKTGVQKKKERGYYENNKEKISISRKKVWEKIKGNNFYSDEEKANRTAIAHKIWDKRRLNNTANIKRKINRV